MYGVYILRLYLTSKHGPRTERVKIELLLLRLSFLIMIQVGILVTISTDL